LNRDVRHRAPFLLFIVGPAVLVALAVALRATRFVEGQESVSRRMLQYVPAARAAAESEGVELALLLAVASAESGGRADARSQPGAVGLMQLMPATAEELAERAGEPPPELDDGRTSLRLGARYLRQQMDRFADEPCARELALAAYIAGPGRVRGWLDERPLQTGRSSLGEWIPYSETRAYVRRVGEWERRYLRMLSQDAAHDSLAAE
jgi:soluble lytic murein transglycosylase